MVNCSCLWSTVVAGTVGLGIEVAETGITTAGNVEGGIECKVDGIGVIKEGVVIVAVDRDTCEVVK